MSKPRSTASLTIAIVLLTLPLLYVCSYLALVDPIPPVTTIVDSNDDPTVRTHNYRLGGEIAASVFWPLEQVDRWLRPDMWIQRMNDTQMELFQRAAEEQRDSSSSQK